jgi:hypothetical protein
VSAVRPLLRSASGKGGVPRYDPRKTILKCRFDTALMERFLRKGAARPTATAKQGDSHGERERTGNEDSPITGIHTE